jgi:DNA-binding transcriptional LysR family regulator
MRSLNLDQLRALEAVTEGKSFSAAARKLNLSQPAVSVQIRELERRFNVKLVERLGKQAHATPPGRELLAVARQIFRECDRAEEVMRRYRDGWIGRVRIGTTNTALTFLLPPLLRKLRHEHPGLELHVTNLPSRESVEAILQNRIDLALVSLPVEAAQLLVTPLMSEHMVAIFPAGARNIPSVVTPQFVMDQPLLMEHTRAAIHDLVLQWLSRQPGQPQISMHLGTIEAIKSAVASDLGMSIIPEIAVSPHDDEIVVRPLRPQLFRTFGLIEHRSKPVEPAFAIVREVLAGLAKMEKGVPVESHARRSQEARRARRVKGRRVG